MSGRFRQAEISIPVYILVILFGISSWIDMNGLFLETPLLVHVLPEGWTLTTYMIIIVQSATIAPITIAILKRKCPLGVKECLPIYVIIGMGTTACLLLAFFWQETAVINGTNHSITIFALTAFMAVADCSVSVVYFPYMAGFKVYYLTAYFVGEGFSGMLPGFIGLAQSIQTTPNCVNQTIHFINKSTGDNATRYEMVPVHPPPRFSIRIFFIILSLITVVSGIAFSILHFHPHCKKERVRQAPNSNSTQADAEVPQGGEKVERYKHYKDGGVPDHMSNYKQTDVEEKKLTTAQFVFIIGLTGLVNALRNGVMHAIDTYVCLPYGSLALTLAVRISAVAAPIMCLVALFLGTKSVKVVTGLSAVATCLAGWYLYLASMSPDPPLKGTDAGVALVIITKVVITCCIGYVKVCNASMLQVHGGARALLWCGVVTQIGSCIGAVVIFICINVLHLFQSELPCSGMKHVVNITSSAF